LCVGVLPEDWICCMVHTSCCESKGVVGRSRCSRAVVCGDCAVCPPQEVAALLDRGVFDNEVLLKEGWVSALKYEDEITDDLKKRTGGKVSTQLVVLAGNVTGKARMGDRPCSGLLGMSRRQGALAPSAAACTLDHECSLVSSAHQESAPTQT
jgi:hypothetical protein